MLCRHVGLSVLPVPCFVGALGAREHGEGDNESDCDGDGDGDSAGDSDSDSDGDGDGDVTGRSGFMERR